MCVVELLFGLRLKLRQLQRWLLVLVLAVLLQLWALVWVQRHRQRQRELQDELFLVHAVRLREVAVGSLECLQLVVALAVA